MTHARVKPDFQNVYFLCELRRVAVRAGGVLRHQILRFFFKPDVRSTFFYKRYQMVKNLFGQEFVFTFGAVEDRNRDALEALTGNAPVWTVFHNTVHAFASPGRHPLVFIINGGERLLSPLVFFLADEPPSVVREDNGLFT